MVCIFLAPKTKMIVPLEVRVAACPVEQRRMVILGLTFLMTDCCQLAKEQVNQCTGPAYVNLWVYVLGVQLWNLQCVIVVIWGHGSCIHRNWRMCFKDQEDPHLTLFFATMKKEIEGKELVKKKKMVLENHERQWKKINKKKIRKDILSPYSGKEK